MNPTRLLFAGTPAFALASLQALVESGIEPVAVLTQPDRRAGRARLLRQSPVKVYAEARGIPVMQPPTLRDEAARSALQALAPDVMIVAAYGLILPQAVLDIPRHGCLNVHASLLPRWRGAAPIPAAILAGDRQTGISLMSMTAGLDTGPVYVRSAVTIGERETAGELHDRLAALGGRLLVEHLPAILDGRLAAIAQDDGASTYAPKIGQDDARLDWREDATVLARRVRAYNPVPGAWFLVDDLRVKCWRAEARPGTDAPPGTVLSVDASASSSDNSSTKSSVNGDAIVVACGNGALAMSALQRPGKKPVSAREFAAAVELGGRRLGDSG